MVKQRFLSLLALSASFFALGVIALGAFTRLIDAGLGCPDWPGCYGHLAVPMTQAGRDLINSQFPATPLVAYKAWAEMVHRYVVGGLSILILSIVTLIFSQEAYRKRGNIILSSCLIVLLIYQIVLGRWTVTLQLLPIIVTQHLLGGFLILSVLWMIYLSNQSANLSIQKNNSRYLPWAIIALIILILQITLGAWTSTNYASLSCSDFPFCINNQSIQLSFKEAFNLFSPIGLNYEGGVLSESARQTIQIVHRLGALVFTLYILIFMIIAMPRLKHVPELISSFYIMIGLLCAQLCIGIVNVLFKLPLMSAVGHNLVAVLLLLSMITFTYKLALVEKRRG